MPRVPHRVRFRPGRLLPLRRRPRSAPRFWRGVDDGRERRPSYRTLGYWELVLQSRNIPHVLVRCGRYDVLYVPPLAEGVARAELEGFSAESEAPPPPRPLPPHPAGNWAVLAFLGLLCWHGLRMGWWPSWGPDSPEPWMNAGALDVIRLRVHHEWYRVVTALTLHADSRHLLGNMAFGAVFLTLLCRRVGLGAGVFLTVAGGAAGNACNALFRPVSFVSLGFSTALFASVGALSGSLALEHHRRRGKGRRCWPCWARKANGWITRPISGGCWWDSAWEPRRNTGATGRNFPRRRSGCWGWALWSEQPCAGGGRCNIPLPTEKNTDAP